MTITAITFDLDDTLWDTAPVIIRAEHQTHAWLQKHYPRITDKYSATDLMDLRAQVAAEEPERAYDFTYMRRKTFRRVACEAGYPEDALTEQAFAIFLEARHRIEFFNDVLPVLGQLVQRYRLVAVSNGNTEIERVGLENFFEFSVNAREVGKPKPHPEIYLRACERLQLSPQQVLHVGDHPEHDMEGAARAGLHTVWLNRKQKLWPQDNHTNPDAEISDLRELIKVLEKVG